MRALLLNTIVLANALLVALPPGWCRGVCVDRQPAAATQPAPAKPTCCQRAQTCPAPESDQAPARPAARCCCSYDATAPEKVTASTDHAWAALPLIAGVLCPELSSPVSHFEAQPPDPSGPPLRVLQCVWRC